jgi:hypothetical protein
MGFDLGGFVGGIASGGVGGIASAITGGTNRQDARAHQGAPAIDDNNFQYGGKAGEAERFANQYGDQAAQAQLRAGPMVDYGQANQDRNNSQAARTQQQMMANQVSARAAGQSPQIATMIANRQRQQAAAAQASQAASARGAAGIALAGQTAANNTARAHADISGQEQINAAQEQRADEANALGAFSNLRQADIASQGQVAQQAQYGAGLQMQQAQLNDARSANYDQMANQVRTTQLAARGNLQQLDSSNRLGAAGINSAVGAQNAQMNQRNSENIMRMASGGLGGAAAKAKGGDISQGRPYLVGEEGPELVIPKQDGVVIPATPTAALLGRPEPRAAGGAMMAGGAPAMAVPQTWGVPTQAAAPPPGVVSTMPGVTASAGDMATVQRLAEENAALRQQMQASIDEKSPVEKDRDRLRARQAIAPETMNDIDQLALRRGDYVMKNAKKDEEAKPAAEVKPTEKADAKKGSKAQQMMGQFAGGEQGNPGMPAIAIPHYQPPQLQSIAARAEGGPVRGGNPYLTGERGPELVIPMLTRRGRK